MRQLTIIIPKQQVHNLLAYAGQEQALHLTEISTKGLPEGVERYEATSILARSSTLRNKISILTSTLSSPDIPGEKIDAPVEDLETLTDFLDKETAKVEQAVRQHEDSLVKLQSERERTQELDRFLSGLESAGVSLDAIGGKGFLTTLAGETARESLQSVQSELNKITYGNLVFAVTGSGEKTQTFIAVFPNAFQEEARQAATALGSKLEPPWSELSTDPGEAKKQIDSRLAQNEQSLRQLEHDRAVLVRDYGPRVKSLSVLSEVLEVRARALSGSSTTEATCMLQAWVPEDRVQQFTEGVLKACEGLVSIHVESPKEHGKNHEAGEPVKGGSEGQTEEADVPPSLVRAPSWALPLQSVINNFGVPSYNETNPLPFMLISYPVIYGLMFGDFGEGPLFILLGLLLWRLKKKGTKIFDIAQPMVDGAELVILLGIGITVFGFVFGDFFGFESQKLFGFPALFSPTQGALENNIVNLKTFMKIVLIFGVAHYAFGLSLSVYNKVRLREYSAAFFGPVCWIWFYLSGVYLVALFALSNFEFSVVLRNWPLLVMVFVPLFLMGWKEGGLEAFEALLSSASNTFSYLRIWALNIADFFFKAA